MSGTDPNGVIVPKSKLSLGWPGRRSEERVSLTGVVVKIATNVNINSPRERVACEQKGPQAVQRCRDRGEHLGVGAALLSSPIPADYDREYKMLKPKVLFHTWVAIYGSGIFDGTFALPKTGRKLDYVSKIKSNARFLEKQRIPLMIVYSLLNLPLEEERRMLSQFGANPTSSC
ncbi:hypothetical protein Q5P01_025938 [Channa striata]|uniref:Uncharacterized protein n=1 Tax=Channa striata TaxID=64152 RepID=A0AA88IJ04_CHASR|nr:hypothetical protein Q5P01_025938 [Channa striata]